MYKIAKKDLSALFHLIAENRELYLPVKTAGQTNFTAWTEDAEVDLDTLVEAAKADFRQEKKRTPITELKLYVKPEEHTAYYVINEKFNGSVAF